MRTVICQIFSSNPAISSLPSFHHAMGHRIGEPQQSRVLCHLALDMPDQFRGQENVLKVRRTALRDDVQYIAAVGLSDNSVHFDDDGAGNKVRVWSTTAT